MTKIIIPVVWHDSVYRQRRSRLHRHQGHHGGWRRSEQKCINRFLRQYQQRSIFKARRKKLMEVTHG